MAQRLVLAVLIATVVAMSVSEWCVSAAVQKRLAFGNAMKEEDWCIWNRGCARMRDNSIRMQVFHGISGGLRSRSMYINGVFSVRLKMPKGNSVGVVPAFYLIDNMTVHNADPNHAEIDFEFLGAENPRDMTLHTNIFVGGYQNLWQFSFAFDPSEAFHTYTIIWSPLAITWMVDYTPIRVLFMDRRLPWPERPLHTKLTFWEAGSWTGGVVNYDNGPKSMYVMAPRINGCVVTNFWSPPWCATSTNRRLPWNQRMTLKQKLRYKKNKRMRLKSAWGWDRA